MQKKSTALALWECKHRNHCMKSRGYYIQGRLITNLNESHSLHSVLPAQPNCLQPSHTYQRAVTAKKVKNDRALAWLLLPQQRLAWRGTVGGSKHEAGSAAAIYGEIICLPCHTSALSEVRQLGTRFYRVRSVASNPVLPLRAGDTRKLIL